MPRIPEKYRIKAVEQLRKLYPHPQVIDGHDVESVTQMLYQTKALVRRYPKSQGYLVIHYQERETETEVSIDYCFVDGMRGNKAPSKEFIQRVLDDASVFVASHFGSSPTG